MRKLFTPLSIKGATLKNRLVFAPTTTGCDSLPLIEKLIEGNVGLIILPDVSVIPSMLGMPSLDTLKWESYFKQVLSLAHAHQCLVSVQLFHPEYDIRLMAQLYSRRGEVSSEEIHRQMGDSMKVYADSLTTQEIEEIIEKFAIAARNASQIGFDMIQVHGDRLAGSFSSSLFNHRTDAFGQRPKFSCDILTRIRKEVPEMIIDYKAAVRTENPPLGKGGILIDELPQFIPQLEAAGADLFHVALANHSTLRDTIPAATHPLLKGEGCFLHLARAVKAVATKPVCVVGKLQHPDFIEQVMNEGFELAALSRQLIADPAWGRKAEENKTEEILYCTYCNARCVSSIMTGKPISCILHEKH